MQVGSVCGNKIFGLKFWPKRSRPLREQWFVGGWRQSVRRMSHWWIVDEKCSSGSGFHRLPRFPTACDAYSRCYRTFWPGDSRWQYWWQWSRQWTLCWAGGRPRGSARTGRPRRRPWNGARGPEWPVPRCELMRARVCGRGWCCCWCCRMWRKRRWSVVGGAPSGGGRPGGAHRCAWIGVPALKKKPHDHTQ